MKVNLSFDSKAYKTFCQFKMASLKFAFFIIYIFMKYYVVFNCFLEIVFFFLVFVSPYPWMLDKSKAY